MMDYIFRYEAPISFFSEHSLCQKEFNNSLCLLVCRPCYKRPIHILCQSFVILYLFFMTKYLLYNSVRLSIHNFFATYGCYYPCLFRLHIQNGIYPNIIFIDLQLSAQNLIIKKFLTVNSIRYDV